VREWWDNAKEHDQIAVLNRLEIDHSLAGMPWAFLPDEVKEQLIRRVRINAQMLAPGWKKSGLGIRA
jgi:hypothetical protein